MPIERADVEPAFEITTWDWKENPDLQELAELASKVTGVRVYITYADTGSDQYAVVISNVPFTEDEATEAFERKYD